MARVSLTSCETTYGHLKCMVIRIKGLHIFVDKGTFCHVAVLIFSPLIVIYKDLHT